MSTVSVILVNFRGADDSIAAAKYLLESDWPADQLEIVVVDNNSGDGSYEKLLEALPECVVRQSGANLGFAGGCNYGVSQASGDIVAFLNNDARPHPRWIAEAVAAIEADPKIGCVASKVLDWDGEKIDYVDGSLTWYGAGYKREVEREDTGLWERPKNVLFPTGAAMFVPRAVYEELEGFDERFFMFYEDVDFGWRVNLAGYDVRYVPTSIAYHKHHASMNKFGNFREIYLLERNALACMYKNYGPELLKRAFAPALALAVERSAARAEMPVEEGPISYDAEATEIWKTAATGPYAVSYFMDILPSLKESREKIQATRKKSDEEILPLMRTAIEPANAVPRYLDAHQALVDFFHIAATFPSESRVLVVTGEVLGEKMAGPAIRAWEMAKRLAPDHTVRLCSTNKVEKGMKAHGFEIHDASSAVPGALHALTGWADTIIFQGFLIEQAPWLIASDKVLIADIYDPMHLEQLEQSRDLGPKGRAQAISDVTMVLNSQMARADYLLCASEKQRQFWLGQLATLGRVNANNLAVADKLESLIGICPFGLDEEPPVQTEHAIRGKVPGIGMDDKVIIWGGGVYNWFDPVSLIRAVDKLKDAHPDVRLYFLGMKHPNPDVPAMRVGQEAVDLAKELGLTGRHVFFNHDWVPYNERQNYLLDANVGASTHFEHVETQFSFRTRILDYLWAGLPIVATRGDSFGNVLDEEGIGISVAPYDVDGLAEALETLLYDEDKAAACKENIARFAERFQWSNALKPLLDFCRKPLRAGDIARLGAREVSMAELTTIDMGMDMRRDSRLVMNYLRQGGPKMVAEKVGSRLKKYLP